MRPITTILTALVVLATLSGGVPLSAREDAALAIDPVPATRGQCLDPTPTPTLGTAPTPMFPLTYLHACNNTGVAGSGLRISVNNAATLSPLVENAPGCPAPRYEYNPPPTPLYYEIRVMWDTACVDPGEAVLLAFGSDCPGCEATVNGYSWLFGAPTPTASPTPTSRATPTPGPTLTPTVVPAGLPKTGGTPDAGGAAPLVMAVLAGFGALLLAAASIGARRRQRR